MTKRMLYVGLRASAGQYRFALLACRSLDPLRARIPPGRPSDALHLRSDPEDALGARHGGAEVVLWGDGQQRRELVHVDDFTRVLLTLAEKAEGETVNIGGVGPDHPGVRRPDQRDCRIRRLANPLRRGALHRGPSEAPPGRETAPVTAGGPLHAAGRRVARDDRVDGPGNGPSRRVGVAGRGDGGGAWLTRPRDDALRCSARLAIALWLLATMALLTTIGFWRTFSFFLKYDDEGCMLITLKQFLDGHALYDEIFSLYGPFPLLVKEGVFLACRQPVGHDAGRVICLVSWLATTMVCSAIAWRLTTFDPCRVGGLPVRLPGARVDLPGAGTSPGILRAAARPGGVAGGLCRTRSRSWDRRDLAGLGVVAGCLAMSKINLFVFLAMARATALAFTPRALADPRTGDPLRSLPPRRARLADARTSERSPGPGVCPECHPGAGAAPHSWIRGSPSAFLGVRHYAWLAGGFLVTLGAISGRMLLHGTSPQGLLEGVLLTPLRVGALYGRPLPGSSDAGRSPSPSAWRRSSGSSWCRRACPRGASHPGFGHLPDRLRAWILGWISSGRYEPFEALFAFAMPAAVLLLFPRDSADRPAIDAFGRLFLGFLAVTESLWAYPVAGSQRAFATFLPALVLVIVVVDAYQDLLAACSLGSRLPGRIALRLMCLGLLAADPSRRAGRGRLGPRILQRAAGPGAPRAAYWIHLDRMSVDRLRRLTKVLDARPDTFFTLPGMDSFYLWTDREPPTTLNLTNWMYMLDDRQQLKIVEQLDAHPQLCMVIDPIVVSFWMQGRPLPPDSPWSGISTRTSPPRSKSATPRSGSGKGSARVVLTRPGLIVPVPAPLIKGDGRLVPCTVDAGAGIVGVDGATLRTSPLLEGRLLQ